MHEYHQTRVMEDSLLWNVTMKLSFQNKLLLSVAALLLLALLLLGGLAGNLLRSELNQALNSEINNNLRLIHSRASAWLESKFSLIESLSEHLPADQQQWVSNLTLARKSGGFGLVYVGTGDGEMVQSLPSTTLPPGFDPRTRPWYQQARQKQGLIVTSPYLDAGTGDLVISMAMPRQADDRDVIASDLAITAVVQELLATDLRWTAQVWMLDEAQKVLAHPDANYLNRDASELLGTSLPAAGQQFGVQYNQRHWMAASIHVSEAGWTFLLLVDEAEAKSGLVGLAWRVVVFSVVIILLSCGLLFLLVRMLMQPVKRLATALEQISEGEADLTSRLQADKNDEFGRMSLAFNRFVERLQRIMQQVIELTRQLDQDAENGRKAAAENLQQLESQQMEITQLASAAHQMSVATGEIAGNAESTASQAQEAAASTREGLKLVEANREGISDLAHQLTEGMQSLQEVDDQVQQITGILVTIQGVAEQTNLLALNAAIEAARAGDHGRGFAVVADEVRALSQRTRSATEEIRQMIEALQSSTEQAVVRMKSCHQQADDSVQGSEHAAERLVSIDQANTHISDMAAQIASAVEEQNAVTSEISGNTEKIRTASDLLADQAEAARQRSEQLRAALSSLKSLTDSFKV